MATRRTLATASIPSEKVLAPGGKDVKSDTSPAVPAAIIYKLLFFTAAMVIAPIGIYFLTLDTVFKGNSTWAGATAALTANVVLIAYIIVAMIEDQGDQKAAEEQRKKGQ